MQKTSQGQLERLNFIDFRVFFTGQVGRTDLMNRFGIKEAAATRDLTFYQREAPENIKYDPVKRAYIIKKTYQRHYIKEIEGKRLLLAFVHGMGDDFMASYKSLVPCELPARLHAPQIENFATISRAIYRKKPLRISYISQSSGPSERSIIPFSFAGNGLRWHVRAYDRKKSAFRDFVINRVESASILTEGSIQEHEQKENDIQWNMRVNLKIVPHPRLDSKQFVEIEHGMCNGELNYPVRAAMAGYILRLWNVDCTPDHSLRDAQYCLWLKNITELKHVENMSIAPGYQLGE